MKENLIEGYLREVLRQIPAAHPERARIAADLRAHCDDALAAGESAESTIARLGDPVDVATAFVAGRTLRYARHWTRLLAFTIDLAILILVEAVLVAWVVLLSSLVPAGTQLVPPSSSGFTYLVGAILVLTVIATVLLMVGVFVLYFPILEGRFGQSLGKRWLGLAVVTEQGMAIGYREAFLRRLPFYFRFSLPDALFVFFTRKRQRAFDIVAHTVVVEVEKR